MHAFEELIGDLRLIEGGATDGQSAVADEVAF
jgi:hypothetical protein